MKVAINGFGRIGKLVMRELLKSSDFEVVAINDLTDVNQLAYLFQYDSSQGGFDGTVEVDGDFLIINGKRIQVFSQRDPIMLPWNKMNIDTVVEATGLFTNYDGASDHIRAGAERVVITAPAGSDVKTIVYNVNHDTLQDTDQIISVGSCTTNCLSLMIREIQNAYGIASGLMTTIHAYTNDQKVLDSPHRKNDYRRARAAAINIIPTTTGAAKAIGLVYPELEGRMDGVSQRVPVAVGSLTELTFQPEKPIANIHELNGLVKAKQDESLGYTDDLVVSSDIIGSTHGALFDATQTKTIGDGAHRLYKVAAWYDNEYSFVHQLVRVMSFLVKIS